MREQFPLAMLADSFKGLCRIILTRLQRLDFFLSIPRVTATPSALPNPRLRTLRLSAFRSANIRRKWKAGGLKVLSPGAARSAQPWVTKREQDKRCKRVGIMVSLLKAAMVLLLSPVLALAAVTSLPATPQGTIQSAQTFPGNVTLPAAQTTAAEPATPSPTVTIAPPADPNAPNPYVEATQPVTQLVDPALMGTSEDPAFKNMTNKIFPMSPEQIQLLYGIQDTTQRAIAGADTTPPRPVISTQPIVLAPGAVPPVIRLGTGYVSSIVFIDQTGAPWPLAAYNIGDPGRFNIQWDKESNVMMIQSQSSYATGNMAVQLKGLDTPVMLTLVSDQRVVDYRLDFRVQGRGPNANTALISGTLPAGNGNMMLMNLLDGVAPAQAKNLQVEGGVAQAWMVEGDLLIRTPLTLLSPSWKATMSSPDGTKVYQLNPTSFVLASEQGRSVTLKIKGL